MKYCFSDKVNKDAVELAYLYLLHREIESEEALNNVLNGSYTIAEYKKIILASDEYGHNISRNLAIDYYIKTQSSFITVIDTSQILDGKTENCITLLQTCDNKRYPILLTASEEFNRLYAKLWELNYTAYQGIKIGTHPHHAMYNRIFVLDELIQLNHTGWIVYLDADAIIKDKNYDIRQKLTTLRKNNQCFWLHNVFGETDDNFQWYHINNGVFAIDLSSPIARKVIKTWKGIYENFYTQKDFDNAIKWMDILDDQSSLSKILEIFSIRNSVCLESLQTFFAYQALRAEGDGISADEELLMRVKNIQKIGQSIYY